MTTELQMIYIKLKGWIDGKSEYKDLSARELLDLKKYFRLNNPSQYYMLFPDEFPPMENDIETTCKFCNTKLALGTGKQVYAGDLKKRAYACLSCWKLHVKQQ